MSEGGVSKLEQIDDTGQRCSSLGQEVARQGERVGLQFKRGTAMKRIALKDVTKLIKLCFLYLIFQGGRVI